jgi:hypothetical protein
VDPNGTWSLFVADAAAQDTGTMSSGWRITLTTAEYTTQVPELASLALFEPGLMGLAFRASRQRSVASERRTDERQ